MKNLRTGLICFFVFFSFINTTFAQTQTKWTLLVYLNAFNNLDPFGDEDINEMEEMGSNSDVRIIVQWASLKRKKVQRLVIEKDNDTKTISSPVVEDLGIVDMGKPETLVDFVKWATERYPSEHIFLDVWNHGSGWHLSQLNNQVEDGFFIQDISHDEISGNMITTEQLGQAIRDLAAHLGKKIDIYGSDACLMSMVEVAAEMKDAISVMIGSQELEPGEGWQYASFLTAWHKIIKESQTNNDLFGNLWGNNNPWSQNQELSDVEKVADALVKTYIETYSREVTLSAWRMSEFDGLTTQFKTWVEELLSSTLPSSKLKSAAQSAQYYDSRDYRDLGHFLTNYSGGSSSFLFSEPGSTTLVSEALKKVIFANQFSEDRANASGASFWFPSSSSNYKKYIKRYESLAFNQATGWSKILEKLF